MPRPLKKPRCVRCRMHHDLCICAQLPSLTTRTRVLLVVHRKELFKSTNTGRLAHLMLAQSHLVVRGLGTPIDASLLGPPSWPRLALYPSTDAVELSRDMVADGPLTLVVPDGNWRQAKRVLPREPALAGIRAVKLPPGPRSAFRLRSHHNDENLSTLEAIARALGIIEGDEIRRRMEDALRLMVERTLWTRGLLHPDEVHGGVPDAALEYQRRRHDIETS